MSSLILYSGFLALALLLLYGLKYNKSVLSNINVLKDQVVLSWLILYIGMGIWIPRSGVTSVAAIDGSALIQIASILLVSLIVLVNIGGSLSGRYFKSPFIYFAVFSFIGMISSVLMSSFLLGIFKAYSVLLTALLAVVTLRRACWKINPAVAYNISYGYFSFMCALAVVGGIFLPEITHRPSGGLFDFILEGVPKLNSNSLGYLAAIVVVISFTRIIYARKLSHSYPYYLLFTIGMVDLILAQARTSIASVFLAMVFVSLAVRRGRPLRILILIAVVMAGSVVLVLSEFSLSDLILEYLKRGVSEEKLKTLSGRTDAWVYVWNRFLDSPIMGYGFYSTWRTEIAPHNSYLTVMLNVGLLGFIPWVMFVFKSFYTVSVNSKELRTEKYNYRLEVLSVILVQFFRTITGHDLTVHSYSTLLILSILVLYYSLGFRKKYEGKTGET